jgi:ABC-type nitrate/sulfonate/bicarbonate transport system substrate-binding protein
LNVTSLLLLSALLAGPIVSAQPLQKITINYPARTGSNWPLFIAKEGGYYQKYGLDVTLVFGVHPAGIAMLVNGDAVMTNYTLEQTMQASARDGSFVFVGTPFKKSLFALMAAKNFSSVKELKGKRIAVSQIGDAPYNYAVGLLATAGMTSRDVTWVPVGTDVNGRAAALVAGRVDATMLTAPAYFKLEQEGFKSLANIADFDSIYAPTVYLFRKATLAANPNLSEQLMKAHAEAIKRFYDDKAFAVQAYTKYSPEDMGDVARVWDRYSATNTMERIPYLPAAAVSYVIEHAPDEQSAVMMKKFDFRTVADQSIVDKLVREGFFEKLFGPGVKEEEARKAKTAFR